MKYQMCNDTKENKWSYKHEDESRIAVHMNVLVSYDLSATVIKRYNASVTYELGEDI